MNFRMRLWCVAFCVLVALPISYPLPITAPAETGETEVAPVETPPLPETPTTAAAPAPAAPAPTAEPAPTTDPVSAEEPNVVGNGGGDSVPVISADDLPPPGSDTPPETPELSAAPPAAPDPAAAAVAPPAPAPAPAAPAPAPAAPAPAAPAAPEPTTPAAAPAAPEPAAEIGQTAGQDAAKLEEAAPATGEAASVAAKPAEHKAVYFRCEEGSAIVSMRAVKNPADHIEGVQFICDTAEPLTADDKVAPTAPAPEEKLSASAKQSRWYGPFEKPDPKVHEVVSLPVIKGGISRVYYKYDQTADDIGYLGYDKDHVESNDDDNRDWSVIAKENCLLVGVEIFNKDNGTPRNLMFRFQCPGQKEDADGVESGKPAEIAGPKFGPDGKPLTAGAAAPMTAPK